MAVILASQSPRRRELLGLFHIPFTVRVAAVDETMNPDELPAEAVSRVSRKKAMAVERTPEDVVIAADTIVVCAGQILGKPKDEEDAFRMLRLLSGRDHQVMTGMTVLKGDVCRSHTEITDIHFRELTDGQIRAYIRTGEPMDKAGSYGIQELPDGILDKYEGSFENIVGLAPEAVVSVLQQLGYKI